MRREKEFEVVRSLINSPWPEMQEGPRGPLTPVAFREIDGRELARQYVAQRELAKVDAVEKTIELPPVSKGTVDGLGEFVPEPRRMERDSDSGGVFSWARRLFALRAED